MSDGTTEAATQLNGTLDLNDIASTNTADLEMRHPATGEPLGWKITFAGPAHPLTTQLRTRERARRQREEMEKERARINGRKWHGVEKTPEEIDAETLVWVVDRIVGWTPVRINGEDYPFTRDNAKRLFGDPRHEKLNSQAIDFLLAEDSFMKRSASNS